MVPIVFGPRIEDVEKVAPPNSFIHAENFLSEKELVNYINYLDKNDTGLLKYSKSGIEKILSLLGVS